VTGRWKPKARDGTPYKVNGLNTAGNRCSVVLSRANSAVPDSIERRVPIETVNRQANPALCSHVTERSRFGSWQLVAGS
jgi:hypothetical protein